MKVPMRWLNDYVQVSLSAEEYARRMVMTGTAVEDIIDLSQAFSGVVVGRVVTCVNMDNSDHLRICNVDVGAGELLQIVCGAPNVAAGALVPVAMIGAKLPGGHEIKKGKLRGVESQGMLCSGTELGISDGLYPNVGDAGLLLFHEDHPLGQDVREIFGIMDKVVDFEILANRPDCLSIWGIARESAAVLDEICLMPNLDVSEDGVGKFEDYASVSVLNADKCPRYCARVITDVEIGPSPDWMCQYLNAAGVRPINNIVDITNFVMLETGHPMHAFDLSKVRDNTIIVRGAKAGEQLVTLDGKVHHLTPDMLVIADAENATGLAGIMGGEESEIMDDTKAVLFECATFDRTNTRLTSRALGVRTEASGRFERGVCVESTMQALDRACMLVNDLGCGKVVSGAYDYYPNHLLQRTVDASVSRINSLIATELTGEQMEDILTRLGIEVELCGDELSCVIPEWRGDITMEADLAEEVLRQYGYDHIPSTLPVGVTMSGRRSDAQLLQDKIKHALVGMGFYEAQNFSFVSPKWLNMLSLEAGDWRLDPVAIKNPLGEDTSVMRTSLVPSMLNSLSTNINRSIPEARLFELSSAFKKRANDSLCDEPRMLTVGMYGDDTDFYKLKDVITCLLQVFGIETVVDKGGDNYFHPGRKATMSADGEVICQLGETHPGVAENFGIETRRVYLAELSLDAIAKKQQPEPQLKPLPKFPSVRYDLALVMDEAVAVGPVMAAINRSAGKYIEELRMFDIYRSELIGQGKKSVAFALTFRAQDRTLTENDITSAVSKVLDAVEQQFGATIRK